MENHLKTLETYEKTIKKSIRKQQKPLENYRNYYKEIETIKTDRNLQKTDGKPFENDRNLL